MCEGESWPFDTRGLPTQVKLASVPSAPPLSLAGVGMRRKNFYITEVDVYLCGLNLSKESLARAKEWKAGGGADLLPKRLLEPAKARRAEGPKVSVTLSFVRAVSKSAVVNAFDGAFKGLPEAEVASFKQALGASVGESGISKGEEIGFFWLNPTGIVVTKNGVVGEAIFSPAVEERLLSVYLDPKLTVSQELYDSVEKNVASVSTL